MKTIYTILFVILFISNDILSQVVSGKLVDENSAGLTEVQMQLYTATNIYNTVSSSDGTFSFTIITGIEEDDQLPTGYSVSDNFPNPFNPRTRISITLPARENIKVEVFNLLGQSVADVIEQDYEAGVNYLDIELNGLPNGFYISRITIGDKYTIVKKLMLIYGSQHLITSGSKINTQLNKFNNTTFETNLDSLVAISNIIGRKTFTGLPNFVSGTLDLGNLTIERFCSDCPTVLYEGKIYHTVQIGSQCWLKENLDAGTMVNSNTQADSMRNNGILEKYCFDNDTANCTAYGGLYQWNEAMQYSTTPGTQGICPPDWHIPTLAEFQTLRVTVNHDGNSLKAVGQGIAGGVGTNTSRFSALLAGYRFSLGGFNSLGYDAYFWSSSEYDASFPYCLYLFNLESYIILYDTLKELGFSVRCVKD
jgi:uncharacterized protein (TIGR02145 family)